MAFSIYGLNLLTPGQLLQNENKDKMQTTAVAPPTLQTTATNFANILLPQYVINQVPFGHYGFTYGPQYLPQFFTNFPPAASFNVLKTKTHEIGPKITTTNRPVVKSREPTTRSPQATFQIKPEKFQANEADFINDVALLQAVKQINPKFVIQDVINVPGKHVHTAKTTVKQLNNKQKQITPEEWTNGGKVIEEDPARSSAVRVNSTAKTSTQGNIPEIPYGSYFLPYFSQNPQQLQKQNGKKPAVLILEPHAKAIVGNGGTAISTPVSKAYLKRGVTTNVYFNPESVAIAGVGGKAHAQADLELDLIK